MAIIKQGFVKKITEDLVLKVASTPEEGLKIAEFNAEIHEQELYEYVIRLYNEHPSRNEILWFFIEDVSIEVENKIVSSAALMPFEWQMGKTKIRVAEMGFVGTSKNYRGQGLFGIINDFYEEALQERDIVLSVLVGIPYYYSRFGYVFSLARFSGYSIPTNNIPGEPIDEIKVRKSTEDDLDDIEKMYYEYNKNYAVYSVFDKNKMVFRLMNDTCDTINAMSYIVEEDRKAKGFFTIGSLDNDNQADIILVSELTYRQMIKVLQFVKTYNPGNVNAFKVNVLKSSSFGRFLRSKGADTINSWMWQIKIPNILRFFQAISPVLEERIEKSIFRQLSRTLSFSNYSDTIYLDFQEGKLVDISLKKEFPTSMVDLRIPSPYSIRLFFSDRSIDEINNIISDAIVKKESKMLIETLFPSIKSIPFSWYE